MKRNILYITCLFLILLGISCSDTIPVSKETSEKPVLFPDYADVTIPYNIAPLNFNYCIYNHRTTKTNQKYPSVNL